MAYADYSYERGLFRDRNFRDCYNSLSRFEDRDAEWYYMRGVCAINLGYYDEGEDYIKRAKFMDPENAEYRAAFDQYITYRNGYNNRADMYNYNRNNLDNGCCCCCGDSCCSTCCQLYLCDSCCECMGGDLIPCC